MAEPVKPEERKPPAGLHLNVNPGGNADKMGHELEKLIADPDVPGSIKALAVSSFAMQAAMEELTELIVLVDDRLEILQLLKRAIEYHETAAKALGKVTQRLLKLDQKEKAK